MHDIGRTQAESWEFPNEAGQFEYPQETGTSAEYPGEFGSAGEFAGETLGENFEVGLGETGPAESSFGETTQEFNPESSFGETAPHEVMTESPYGETSMQEMSGESPLSEAEEMSLAAEFLEVSNEEELDRFLGRLVRRVGKFAKRYARPFGGILKNVAKMGLPLAGKAFGTFLGGPLGGMIGGKLASAAGNMFGLELEGLSSEEAEFEVARRFVRLASVAGRNPVFMSPNVPPAVAARTAVVSAARRYAPGVASILNNASQPMPNGPVRAGTGRRGMWYRIGRRRIILIGV
jgi:hypothetical protein